MVNYLQTTSAVQPNSCVEYQIPTGRLVWNISGDNGGVPVQVAGQQTITVWLGFACPICSKALGNGAIEGVGPGGAFPGTAMLYNRFDCKLDANEVDPIIMDAGS